MLKSPFSYLIFGITLLLGDCSNYGCLFEFPHDKNELIVSEVLLFDNYSTPQNLRTTKFIGHGNNFFYEYEFNRFMYSLDGNTAFFWNGQKGFMNYGANRDLFNQSIDIRHPSFLDNYSSNQRSDFDYHSSLNKSIYHSYQSSYKINPFTGDSIYITNHSLIEHDYSSERDDTLLIYETIFPDTNLYSETQIFDQRYTASTDILFTAHTILYEITEYSNDGYLTSGEISRQVLLLKTNYSKTIDTLLVLNSENISPFHIIPTVFKSKLYITYDNKTYLFDLESKSEKLLYNGGEPQNFSNDESALTFDKGKRYYHFESGKVLDLTDYFPNIIYSMPHKNIVAVQTHPETDTIYLFDIDKESIINTITVDDLPAFEPVYGNSTYRLENPVFIENGDLIIMNIRQTYLTDLEYERRCG